MTLMKYLMASAALSTAVLPSMAAAANPAAGLSVAQSPRVATKAGNVSKLEGEYGVYLAAGALIAVLVTIFIVVDHDDDPRSP